MKNRGKISFLFCHICFLKYKFIKEIKCVPIIVGIRVTEVKDDVRDPEAMVGLGDDLSFGTK